jgi:hypothetical protein
MERETQQLGGAELRPAGALPLVRPWLGVKEGAHGGTMGSPVQSEWGYSCRLVDLIGRL